MQDWWGEHPLPEATPALAWTIKRAEQQPIFSERTLTYDVAIRVEDRGAKLSPGE